MIKQIGSQFARDMTIAYRNGYLWVILVILGVMLGLVWLLPKKIEVQASQLIFDASPEKSFANYLLQHGRSTDNIYTSRAALEEDLGKNNRGIGIIFEGDPEKPKFTIISEGQISKQNLNIFKATLENIILDIEGEQTPAANKVILLRKISTPIPFNQKGIPVFLVFEVIVFGFFIIAVMVFQEKQEGTIFVYRVSPSGTLSYIFSKLILFLIFSLAYGALLVLFTKGLTVHYGNLFLLVGLNITLLTLIGLIVAVFFNNISEWFFVGVFILILNMLPIVSYAFPSFAPPFITLLPSYSALFGVKEILFPTGKSGFMQPVLLVLIIENLVALAICYWVVRKKLMREGN